MRVDQSWYQDVVRQLDSFVRRKLRRGLRRGQNRFDGTVAYRDRVVLEDRARRLDWDDPAGAEEENFPRRFVF